MISSWWCITFGHDWRRYRTVDARRRLQPDGSIVESKIDAYYVERACACGAVQRVEVP